MGARLAVAAVLIAAVLLTFYLGPMWVWLLLLELFLATALWEFFRLLRHHSLGGFRLTAVTTVASPIIWAALPSRIPVYLFIVPIVLLIRGLCCGGPVAARLRLSAANILCFFYLGLPFSLAVLARQSAAAGSSRHDLVFVLISVWLSDSAAFLVGRQIGRHKVTPRLSPNKSLEGFVAALVVPCAAAALLQPMLLAGYSTRAAVLLGGWVGGAAVAGDLFESLLKRKAGVKDSSGLLPGHGGVLDRIDSLLFALPCYYLLMVSLGL
jgi:phosphatidate cytidylyltransferase